MAVEKFKVKKGHFVDEAHKKYECELLFSGAAQLKQETANGSPAPIVAISGKQHVVWVREASPISKDNNFEEAIIDAGPEQSEENSGLKSISGEPEALNEGANWRIVEWHTQSLSTMETLKRPFDEVLEQALPDPDDLTRARRSIHEEMVIQLLLDPKNFEKPHSIQLTAPCCE